MDDVLGPFDHLSDTQLSEILTLWNSSYPVGICYKDLDAFKNFLNPLSSIKHFLILSESNSIKAWIMTFDREQERWFSIIVSEAAKGQGLGKKLLSYVLQNDSPLCGWVVDHENDFKKDGTPYLSPLPFYKKLGFEVITSERYEKPGISCVKVKGSID